MIDFPVPFLSDTSTPPTLPPRRGWDPLPLEFLIPYVGGMDIFRKYMTKYYLV